MPSLYGDPSCLAHSLRWISTVHEVCHKAKTRRCKPKTRPSVTRTLVYQGWQTILRRVVLAMLLLRKLKNCLTHGMAKVEPAIRRTLLAGCVLRKNLGDGKGWQTTLRRAVLGGFFLRSKTTVLRNQCVTAKGWADDIPEITVFGGSVCTSLQLF